VVPSPNESLSLLALEAMAVGTPVLVNARSTVLVDHCKQSHAGLYYADRWEFTEALKLLMKDAKLRATLGRNGKQYVNKNYRWSHVLRKYERLFARLSGPGADASPRPPQQPDRDRGDRGDRDGNRDRGPRDSGGRGGRDRNRGRFPRRSR